MVTNWTTLKPSLETEKTWKTGEPSHQRKMVIALSIIPMYMLLTLFSTHSVQAQNCSFHVTLTKKQPNVYLPLSVAMLTITSIHIRLCCGEVSVVQAWSKGRVWAVCTQWWLTALQPSSWLWLVASVQRRCISADHSRTTHWRLIFCFLFNKLSVSYYAVRSFNKYVKEIFS